MRTQEALVGGALGHYHLINDAEIPNPDPDMMLCKVAVVALNPADAKMVDFSATPGSVGGNNFAGEVIEVGDDVTRLRKGDRIFAMSFELNPSNKTTGAFGTYALASADLSCKIPDWMSYEEASTMGVAVGTAGTALFQALELPLPTSPAKKPFAAETFDYHSPTCGTEIRVYTGNALAHVLDCVTDAATMKICYEGIGTAGGKYIALDPFATHVQYTRREVQANWLMIYSLFGKPVKLAGVYGRPASPEDRGFAARLFPIAEQLLSQGLLKPHPIEIRSGGLKGITDGIEDLRKGRVRAKKLVYPVA